MKRKLRLILKALLLLLIPVLAFLLLICFINRARKPGPQESRDTSFLNRYISAIPENSLYIRDIEGFVRKASLDPGLVYLWESCFKDSYHRLLDNLNAKVPVISHETLIYEIIGNELLLYSDKNREIYLLSRTKLAGQLALNSLLCFNKLAYRRNLPLRIKTGSERYPEIFIRFYGSVLSVSTSIPANEGLVHSGHGAFNYNNPDMVICLSDTDFFSTFLAIPGDSPLYTIWKIVRDRKVNLISAGFSPDEFYVNFFSSSITDDNNDIAEAFRVFCQRKLDSYPFYIHYNTPKNLRIQDNALYYNESRLFSFNISRQPVIISTPFSLIISKAENKGAFPVIYSDFRDISNAEPIIEKINRIKLPFTISQQYMDNYKIISNSPGFRNQYFELQDNAFLSGSRERIYIYCDLMRLFASADGFAKAIFLFYPDLSGLYSFLNKLQSADRNMTISLYSTKYESIITLTTRDFFQ